MVFFPLLLGSSISFFLVSCSGGSDVTQEERVRDAEIFLPELAGGLGPGLGRKYAYLVLPAVLMPRVGFPSLVRFDDLVSSVPVAPVGAT